MKSIFLSLVIFLLRAGSLLACVCIPPTLEESITDYDVVFLGEVIEQYDSSGVFPLKGWGVYGMALANFKVIKHYRGVDEYSEIVTVFDSGSFTTCSGVFHEIKEGDTVLVFAEIREIGTRFFAQSNICTRTKAYQDLDSEEIEFVNRKGFWSVPTLPDGKVPWTKKIVVETENTTVHQGALVEFLLALLATSLALNIFLWKKSRD